MSVFSVGCGNQTSRSVQQAVTDNQQAETLLDWEQSSSNPTALFEEWRLAVQKDPTQLEKLQKEICQELLALDGQSLSIFDEEIRRTDNEDLIKLCKEALHQKIEKYFDIERNRLAVRINPLEPTPSKNNFRFPKNIQYRDISKGYYAVTGDVSMKEVILTFDDGPSRLYTESILRSLKEVNARAIFFHLGKNVRENPEVVKKVAAGGHAIGSHTTSHSCLAPNNICLKHNGRMFTLNEAIDEIKSGHQALYDVLGWADPFFRFPYGEPSTELRKFLNENSTAEFAWNIESEDWRAQPIDRYINNVLGQLEVKGRGIVLMHDIQRRTAEALPQLLRELYSRGFSVVTLRSVNPADRYHSKLVKKNLP